MSNDTEAGRAHPLVGLLFWMMGKDLQAEAAAKEAAGKEQVEQDRDPTERIQRRSLSWKDDTPDGALATWHEFADVKAPDVAIASDKPGNSSLKSGTTLHRKHNTIDDNEDEDGKKRRSPNSPNWGFFVSITPPTEFYPPSPGSTSSLGSSRAGSSREVTPKNSDTHAPTIAGGGGDGKGKDIAFPLASPGTVTPPLPSSGSGSGSASEGEGRDLLQKIQAKKADSIEG